MNYKINRILCFFFGHKIKYSVYNKRYKKCMICDSKWQKKRTGWQKIKNE